LSSSRVLALGVDVEVLHIALAQGDVMAEGTEVGLQGGHRNAEPGVAQREDGGRTGSQIPVQSHIEPVHLVSREEAKVVDRREFAGNVNGARQRQGVLAVAGGAKSA